MNSQKIKYPLILVNFKAYREATGSNALRLAKIAEEVHNETGVCVSLAPQFCDIRLLAEEVTLPIFAQHVDPISFGGFTGSVLPDAVKEAGATGTLINHSERQLKISEIAEAIRISKELGLTTVACANSESVSAALAALGPEIISIEPPQLIGTGIAVSKAQPQLVSGTIKTAKSVNESVHILCGAGITSGEDVAAALRLGSEGVLLASGLVKAKDPRIVLLDMTRAVTSRKGV